MKGNNFRDFSFASLDIKALPKMGSTLKGKNLLMGANSFLKELTPIEKKGKK